MSGGGAGGGILKAQSEKPSAGLRSHLADSAAPVAAGTERVAGGGGQGQAPAVGAGGVAVCPGREGMDRNTQTESGLDHPSHRVEARSLVAWDSQPWSTGLGAAH